MMLFPGALVSATIPTVWSGDCDDVSVTVNRSFRLKRTLIVLQSASFCDAAMLESLAPMMLVSCW